MPVSKPSLTTPANMGGRGLWAVDLGSGAWIWSDEVKAVLGLPTHSRACWETLLDVVHPADHALFGSVAGHRPAALPDAVFRVKAAAGEHVRLVRSTSLLMPNKAGPGQVFGVLEDISDHHRAEMERDASEMRLNTVLTIGRMIVWDLDTATGIVTRSANADDVVGVRQEQISAFVNRVHPDDRHMVEWEDSTNPAPPNKGVRFRYRHPNGSLVWLESAAIRVSPNDALGHVIGITMDVTERQSYEERLLHAANHDPLTGLLNRKSWRRTVDSMFGPSSGSARKRCHVLLLDLDHFKSVNDSHGHDAGDAVIQAVAERLRACPGLQNAARLGGDEFAACLPGQDGPAVLRQAEALVAAVARPIRVGERELVVGGSIGLARWTEDVTQPNDLLRNADLALYAAKHAGRGRARLFEASMRKARHHQHTMEADFADALNEGKVLPFYQPRLDLVSGQLVGFEALARWLHPQAGVLAPTAFGSVFESPELSRRLGTQMRRAVASDVSAWRATGLDVGTVAINCAAIEFQAPDLGDVILDVWRSAGLPPRTLIIEVAESALTGRNADFVERGLRTLRDAGVGTTLDGFGTGSVSLVHLTRLALSGIEIDRSLLAGTDQPATRTTIRAVVAAAASLGLSTLAEGVETAEQAALLAAMGCSQAQGFFWSKPLSASRVPWFIRSGGKRHRRLRALAS